ncbi:protein FAR1-RELATED SEQUENCE 5 [Sorghum bicolor]|nr:protein FAR1-RELATED SEQUENCE 5 [Sorghum bicolor]|eukprot:XP_021321752.1 protein FAR1-RELATED SEQUENCE 5 [Sorghum bicolor]
MVVRYKVDEGGRIVHMLWCTGKNQQNYDRFGDAMTFDTTYRTNLYNMPFGLFVRVNNHFQSVVFGGVLLTSEKTEDFEWAFANFKDIMKGKEPMTILTDQCQAMAAAIKTTLQTSRHRWCKWHVLRKAKQWLGNVYTKNTGFKSEFNKLVTEEVSIIKFERRWRQLVRKYGVEKNKYLKRIYKHRGMWARPYFMHVFCAGMTSTQRSESANHMLKGFIQRSAPMHIFVSKFNEFQNDRIAQEEKEIHVTKQMKRKRRIGVPIERHAEEIYTRAMYDRLYNELYHAGSYLIKGRGADEAYILVHYKEDGATDEKLFLVKDSGNFISCSCGLYNHVGMLCRHALKVLMHLDRTELPSGNILARWRRDVACETGHVSGQGVETSSLESATYIQKKLMVRRVLAKAGVERTLDESGYKEAMDALDKIISVRTTRVEEKKIELGETSEKPTSCPKRAVKKGRRQNTSLKSYKASLKEQNKRKKYEEDEISSTSDNEQVTGTRKTKALWEIE